MNLKTMPLLAAFLFLVAMPASGETVTLREAVQRALESNNLLKAAAFDLGAARQDVASSRSRYLPRVYLEGAAALSTTPSTVFMMKLDEGRIGAGDFAPDALNDPSPRADFKTSVTLEQPLVDFGIGTGVAMAAKNAEASELSLAARREEIAFRVYLAYLGVRRAEAFVEVAQKALSSAREHDRVAALKEKDGIGLKSDRLRTATALAEAEQRLVTAKNDLTLARMRLNLLVGGPQGGELDIDGLPVLAEPERDQGRLVDLALESRTDLKAARTSVQKGELAVEKAREAYLPTLYARGAYQVNDRDFPLGGDQDSWTVGMNLRWELFDGARRSHERKKAELSRQGAEAVLENEKREAALQVTESVLRREEAALRLESARAAVRDAEEAQRLVGLRFGNGLSPLVELLETEAALNRARANLVEVENGMLAATGEVYYSSGVFLKEVMR